MALRIYICPVIGSGTKGNAYRNKAFDSRNASTLGIANFFPSVLNGVPTSVWAVAVVSATDFALIDADASCDDIFQGDLPASIVDRASLVAFISGRTVGDVPTARRNLITGILDKYGVNHADFTLATPLGKVIQRIASTLYGKDDTFGATVLQWIW